ncbi:homogentisate 1,2-dioxygenase [Tenacibaculum finnmarkense genomovar finnmarkense]|uniref:Putative enzyme n=2 Tax=Tenacibaculum finnmarkense TaxID=2781243 RepID=A0A2I2LD40_9FLAO|nr:homogentisate 1,2-dioxygenase [Tenacibaculum finnmarkense]ALU73888.1 homogentisate 1,2-dioxygenase [Tenacibaculum dicentrarchi]MBE7645290.1 homogentisate 1,2-dioxygenase [Tenacibaculum finnmarkense genomovar ulcerans]MBE7660243.1 homogentisate 1,2-dioxygenase [Tenacibaculum finnmarkense genomovar finnmarkense]MBE7687212.1 homogentisate 1,2-dioxygenase [Tenacibaculum finnmarkense genomovar ulcerans]MBE7692088.1 homogentisate 1,2-dioxygenase [Tenacibaculum finnmarkense genomovar finnmarkense]
MPFYHKLGNIPPKRHTQFRKEDGSLYYEQLFGTIGFDGMSTNSYHEFRPTMVKEIRRQYSVKPKIAKANNIQSYRFRGFQVAPENDYLESRKIVLTNSDCNIILAAPKQSTTDYFYKNSDADEVIFIHKGTGKLRTMLGNINFKYGDYLVIPRGIIYKLDFDDQNNRLFIVESYSPVYTPKRYRNHFGQLLEHAPFCERDIRRPQELETHNELGDFLINVKKQGEIIEMIYASHPFDVVGYDGYNYPYAFSIHDFEPITGRVHQPPPVHQTFETNTFVICSFVPRLYDYHPNAIPAPYNHSNIDSDEVLYYVDGDFMSRNDIDQGHISLHPAGIPHGPHPGAAERSIGHTKTEELAVMVDTFKPLQVTEEAMKIADENYYKSWLEH